MKRTIFIASAFAALLSFFSGCYSVPKEIPEELDARQLIQLGQDNYDLHRYKAAEIYFNEVLKRFGDDPKHFLEAKYELGHLYLKQKKYNAAYDNFTEIQEIYENIPVGLPGSYKILCGIELAKIPQDKIKDFEAKAQAKKEEAELEAQKARQEQEERRQKEEQEQRERQIRESAAKENAVETSKAAEENSAQEQGEKALEGEIQKQEEEKPKEKEGEQAQ